MVPIVTEIFFILLIVAAAKFLLVFTLPYFLCWKLIPYKFRKYKIQTIERQKPQIPLELRYSLSTLLIQTLIFLLIYWMNQKNHLDIYSGFGSRGYLPELMAFVAYFVFYDAYFYWTHRLLHQSWFYKNVHVVHHMSLNPTPFASYSFHPIEAFISQLYFFPLLYFSAVSFEMLIVLVVLTDIGNLAGHLGYDFTPKFMWKSRWGKWLTTPTHHNLHHQFSKANYGLYWRGWDELCKTLHSKTESEFYRVKAQR